MAKKKNVRHISPTDTDSKLMKARRGKFAGYNMQIIVDADSHMVVNALIEDSANDRNALYGSITETCDVYSSQTKTDYGG